MMRHDPIVFVVDSHFTARVCGESGGGCLAGWDGAGEACQ